MEQAQKKNSKGFQAISWAKKRLSKDENFLGKPQIYYPCSQAFFR
jgi:hypothetical protein